MTVKALKISQVKHAEVQYQMYHTASLTPSWSDLVVIDCSLFTNQSILEADPKECLYSSADLLQAVPAKWREVRPSFFLR